MADRAIGELPLLSAFERNTKIPVEQNGVGKHATGETLIAYLENEMGLSSAMESRISSLETKILRTVALDFSRWDAGVVLERVEGRSDSYEYNITFSGAMPTRIDYNDGTSLSIRW